MAADTRDGRLGPGISADARLALIEELERREGRAVRRAAWMAWLSLAAAAVLLSVLVFGAWSQLRRLRSDVVSLETERAALARSTEAQRGELARVESELREKRSALSTLIAALRRSNESARSGVVTALDADPKATVLVPRAYVQIADEADRQWARNLSDRLQHAGIIPVGIEHVPQAARLRRFEVRYYKKSEEAAANRIVSVLDGAGVPASPVYLNLETNTRVRANHFEIWCPPNARAARLRPLTASSP